MSSFESLFHPMHRLKTHLGPLWWHSLLMFMASRFGDMISLYIGMFIVPDVLDEDKLGAVLPLMRLIGLVGVPLAVVAGTAMKYVNVLLTRGEHGKIKALLRDLALLSSAISLVLIAALFVFWPFVQARLKVEDRGLQWVIAGTLLLGCWSPMAQTLAQGLKHFYRLILAKIVGPVARLVTILICLSALQVVGYLAANLVSGAALLLLLSGGLFRYCRRTIAVKPYRDLVPEMIRYAIPLGLTALVFGIQFTVEPWVIRHRLTELDSAGYYIAAMFGNIPMWVAPAMVPFLFPLVSERHERGESTGRMHIQAVAMVLVIGLCITIVLGLFGGRILEMRPAWQTYRSYAPFMWQISLITTLDTLLACHITHENACRRFSYLRYCIPLALGTSALLYVLMGWSSLSAMLPPALWDRINGAFSLNLQFVIGIMLSARLLAVVFLIWSLCARYCCRKRGAPPGSGVKREATEELC